MPLAINAVDIGLVSGPHERMLASLVHLSHWAVLGFVLLGWLSPWQPALWLHLAVVPGLIAHWKTNENRCYLTELEAKLKSTNKTKQKAMDKTAPERAEEGQFLKGIWRSALGREPSERQLSAVMYTLMALVWLASLCRLGLG